VFSTELFEIGYNSCLDLDSFSRSFGRKIHVVDWFAMNHGGNHLQGLFDLLNRIDIVLNHGLHDLFGKTMRHAYNDVQLGGLNGERTAATNAVRRSMA